jgi:hypothetical protein
MVHRRGCTSIDDGPVATDGRRERNVSVVLGVVLALGVGGMCTLCGLDRDRALYPAVMIVIALYYVLFALIGGSTQVLIVESAVAIGFIGLALAGFRSTLWLVVAALGAHGVFDLAHPHIYANRGVPAWWPSFCIAYDVVAAAYLAWLLASKKVRADAALTSAT